jgi:hypothetical protein
MHFNACSDWEVFFERATRSTVWLRMDGSLGVNFEHIALSLRNGKNGRNGALEDGFVTIQTNLMDRAVNVGRS